MRDITKILKLLILIAICYDTCFGQIDTNKRYIGNLTITSDTTLSGLTFILKNKISKIEIINSPSISDICFFKNDTVEMVINYNGHQLVINEFNKLFPYADFTHSVKIHLSKKYVLCTQIEHNDGRHGEFYVTSFNCKNFLDTDKYVNSGSVFTYGEIKKINYTELKN